MVRTPSSDKNGLKKGTWTPEEDKKLVDYVTRYGHWNWRLLPKFAGLKRCGKSCRLRWLNYLRPNLKRGNYTEEEEETIIKLHRLLGNRWSAIAAQMPGRTDNEIKNHWNTNLKKRSQPNLSVTKAQPSNSKDQLSQVQNEDSIIDPFQSQISQQQSSSSESSSASSYENLVLEDEFTFLDSDTLFMSGNVWLEPFVFDISSHVLSEPDEYFDAELWSHDN